MTINVCIRPLAEPLWMVSQPQVPERPVQALLLLRSRAAVRMIHIPATTCGPAAGLRHGGQVAKVIGQEADWVVRSGLYHLQDGPAQQFPHPGMRKELPVGVRLCGSAPGYPGRSCTRPALLFVSHCWWRHVCRSDESGSYGPETVSVQIDCVLVTVFLIPF